MNKIEEYSIRRILNEFPRVNFIKKVDNIYTVTLNTTYLTLEEIEKINKELILNNYELQKISVSESKNIDLIGRIDLIFIKNIQIGNSLKILLIEYSSILFILKSHSLYYTKFVSDALGFIKNDISQLLIGAIIGVVIGIIIKSVI